MRDWVKPYLLKRTEKGLSGLSKRAKTEILKNKTEELSNVGTVFIALTDDLNCNFSGGGLGGGQEFMEVFGGVLSDLPEDVFM